MSPIQRKAFKALFKGLYQKGFLVDTSKFTPKFKEVEVCTEFIPVDGAASEEQVEEVIKRLPRYCQGLPKEDLFFLSTLLNEEKLFSEIFLEYNHPIPNLPEAETNWKFGTSEI